MSEVIYWVYILNCENNSFYTGYTTDMVRRYQEHLNGSSKCKYTRSFKPLSVAHCWPIAGCKSKAMQVEKFIKKLSKEEKKNLLLKPENLEKLFQRYCSVSK